MEIFFWEFLVESLKKNLSVIPRSILQGIPWEFSEGIPVRVPEKIHSGIPEEITVEISGHIKEYLEDLQEGSLVKILKLSLKKFL